MPRPRSVSIRSIAELTGLSKATVANALNGSTTVAPATAEKVRVAAEQIGYKRNPMVGALMSALRRSQVSNLQGVLAVVEIVEPERPEHGLFHQELLAGCRECAEELGFKVESYRIEPGGLSPKRLSGILKARGIRGLVLLPMWRTPDFSSFDWEWFTGVYADYITEKPTLNSVCCDHYRSMLELLQLLYERGYRRPGLIIERGRDERVHSRTSAAARVFQAATGGVEAIEPLLADGLDERRFADWLERERPDVVLGHQSETLDWLRRSGRSVPEQIGFVGLNLAKTKHACACLDLRPRQIGRSAVEVLIGQVQRQAWGLPGTPTNTTISCLYVDGPTVRGAAV